jgi:hypothetical protein
MEAKPKLAGRIIKGVLSGVIDGLPFVSNIVNAVRQNRAEKNPPVPVTAEPVTRTVTGWVTIVAILLAALVNWKNGAVDCDTVNQIIKILG